MDESSTVIKIAEHKIKPFKNIRIGDPMYFERLKNDDNPKLYKDLVCDIKTSCCKVGVVKISESVINTEYCEFNQIDVDVILAKDDNQLEVYKNGQWYGEKTMKRRYNLGCDTASYEIEVDGRYEKIHTGSDGYYGELRQMKQYYGLMLSLFFDGDLFSFEEIERIMDYLFAIEK